MARLQSIKEIIRNNGFLSHVYSGLMFSKWVSDKNNRANLDKVLKTFEPNASDQRKRQLSKMILRDHFRYRIMFSEFFLFHFEDLNHKGKRLFMGEHEKNDLCEQLSSPEVRKITSDKFNTYKALSPFFKRELISVDKDTDRAEFDRFIAEHGKVILKPRGESGGRGIRLIDSSRDDLNALFDELSINGAVLEELIIQSEGLGQFHPASVNTVRYATFIGKDGIVTPLYALFRMGRGNSFVDNAGAGGILAMVDIETGVIEAEGITESGEKHLIHPDTGKVIVGFMIPHWEELKQMGEKIARELSQIPYLSMDMALTEDRGWVLVEANSKGQLGNQFFGPKGCRELIERVFNAKNGKILN